MLCEPKKQLPIILASKAMVRGVDYLFLGKDNNFRGKEENIKGGAGLARLGSVFGAVDAEKSQKRIHVHCGVDLRPVDPEDGTANQEGVIYCPQCGAKLNSEARFCRECGAALK